TARARNRSSSSSPLLRPQVRRGPRQGVCASPRRQGRAHTAHAVAAAGPAERLLTSVSQMSSGREGSAKKLFGPLAFTEMAAAGLPEPPPPTAMVPAGHGAVMRVSTPGWSESGPSGATTAPASLPQVVTLAIAASKALPLNSIASQAAAVGNDEVR